ncbi:MAG: hypothetical protein AB8F78_09880 [Saprospiraceae bacterium]
MILRVLVAFFGLSLLSSCATVGKHAGFVGSSTKAEQEKMVVTLMYPRSYPISQAFKVLQEDLSVGEVRPGQYLVWETNVPEDNRMLISVKGFDNDVAVLRPAGKTQQFLKLEVSTDGIQAIMSLVPATEEEALAFMSKGNKGKATKRNASGSGR